MISRQVSSTQQMSRLQSVQSNFKNHLQRDGKPKEPMPYQAVINVNINNNHAPFSGNAFSAASNINSGPKMRSDGPTESAFRPKTNKQDETNTSLEQELQRQMRSSPTQEAEKQVFKSADQDLERLERLKSQDSGRPRSSNRSNWSNAQIKQEERKNKIQSVLLNPNGGSSDSMKQAAQNDPRDGGLSNILNQIEDSNKSNCSNAFRSSPNLLNSGNNLSKHNSLEFRRDPSQSYLRQQVLRSNSIENALQKRHSLGSHRP